VPLVSLRAAAGHWSEDQAPVEGVGEWAEDWVEFDAGTNFEPGMFVAKVIGDSMEPEIPNGSYCLFRPPQGGSRQGRRVLAWHAGVTDPHTGGQYTVKVYSSEKVENPDSEWRHTRITLKPLNSAYEPIVLTPESEEDVRVIAEFVEVVGPAG
jgi:phage repressor protein C with HTH and peptisase S24 domain